MPFPPIVPQGEALRRAIAWLAEHNWTPPLIEQACQRFDLAPADEEFLLRELRRWQALGEAWRPRTHVVPMPVGESGHWGPSALR